MVNGITFFTVWVHEQDDALAFYTDKLGLELRDDVTVPEMGNFHWVTVGVHSRDNQRVYHVQDQRYSFEVRQVDGRRDQAYVPVAAEVEDL